MGADKLAEKYAKHYDIPTKIFLPDWNQFGKSAWYIRNKLIVENADIVIAFYDGASKGTKLTIDLVKK